MLKTVYDNEEDIPEGYAALYTEKNGKWELTGVQGVKTQADIDRLQGALTKERKDHKDTKDKLALFGELNADEVHQKLEGFDSLNEQLEALKSGGAFDEEKMEPIIQSRVRQALGPIEREKTTIQRKLDEAQRKLGEKDTEVVSLRTSITTGNIERALRDAAVEAKVVAHAMLDVVGRGRSIFEEEEGTGRIVTKDVPGVTPGITPKEWLKDLQEQAPHFWPISVGGGSGKGPNGGLPSGTANPWSKEGWNVTAQGKYAREHGEAKAREMAQKAGVDLGATKPAAA